MDTDPDLWLIAEPSVGLQLLAGDDTVYLRSRAGALRGIKDLAALQPVSRLGRLVSTLIPQLLELGIATQDSDGYRIPYDDFVSLEEKGFDAFDGVVPWSPFILGLEASRWLTDSAFRYFVRFFLGNNPVPVTCKGCFVRRGQDTFRLDAQTFALVRAIEKFNGLSPEQKASADSLLHFAQIKGLAHEVGADLDAYLTHERVLVPSRIGLDVVTDTDGRITFVPKVSGVPDEALKEAFLTLDDVDPCYTCSLSGGDRVRVVLTEVQREVLKRMQRVRHLGGAERAEVLRNPIAVFDGVAEAIDIDLRQFGPRVRGIGDFPFVARPYLQRSATGVFDADNERAPQPSRFEAGLACTYADGSEDRVAFTSREEILKLKAEADNAWRSGEGHVLFRDKSIVVDQSFMQSLKELEARVTKKPEREAVHDSR